ncbi:hypothetical protein GW17_00043949 [Ensete ventricosum]|nr:hypothetical protein GW17_00043949 [Ensete ventricosum]
MIWNISVPIIVCPLVAVAELTLKTSGHQFDMEDDRASKRHPIDHSLLVQCCKEGSNIWRCATGDCTRRPVLQGPMQADRPHECTTKGCIRLTYQSPTAASNQSKEEHSSRKTGPIKERRGAGGRTKQTEEERGEAK